MSRIKRVMAKMGLPKFEVGDRVVVVRTGYIGTIAEVQKRPMDRPDTLRLKLEGSVHELHVSAAEVQHA